MDLKHVNDYYSFIIYSCSRSKEKNTKKLSLLARLSVDFSEYEGSKASVISMILKINILYFIYF